ncbi:MAG TPA: hypothetical protein EYH42_04780 [Sulfurovum sp.]|nr:hypothetical protein [Sulfurovum sp.]
MHILLINNNPVVSRLFTLCTRDVHMILEEVEDIETLARKHYDVVFVDEALYEGKVQNLNVLLDMQIKILLSSVDLEINDFDMTIKKPFLPSQIIDVLENIVEEDSKIEEKNVVEVENIEIDEHSVISDTKVLNSAEIERIKSLLDMDDYSIESDQEELKEEEYEARKIEVIKEQLKAEGLEIVDENEILDELETDTLEEILPTSLEEYTKGKKEKKTHKEKVKSIKKKKQKKEKKKSSKLTENELESIENTVQIIVHSLKKKQIKKLLKGKEIEITLKLEANK